MEVLEAAEKKPLHGASASYYMPMITFEEEVDVSYLEPGRAADISDSIACTNVGEIRHTLDRQFRQCMLSELCKDDDESSNTVEEVGADYGSPMGVIPMNLETIGLEIWPRRLGQDSLLFLARSSTIRVRASVARTF